VSKLIPLVEAGVGIRVELGDFGKDWSAHYDWTPDGGGLLRINTRMELDEAHRAADFLHEVIHAVTEAVIESPQAVRLSIAQRTGLRMLNDLFESVKSDPRLAGEYGVTDIHEFLAEALSNPKFQEKLKGIHADGEAARLRAVSVGKNYFTRAIEKLGALFGKRIVWVVSNGLFDGVINYRSDKDTIFIDPSSTRGAYVIVGHEIGYHLAEESPNVPNDGVAGTVTVEAANETFGRITGKWNKSSPAFLHDTFASAPDYVQQTIHDSGGTEKTGGVYVNGEVHVIRENHESAEALERTLLHEGSHPIASSSGVTGSYAAFADGG
jgi:hypothetical protein